MSLPNTVPQVTLQGTSSKGLFCLQRILLPPKNTPFGFLFACFSYPVVGHSCSSWLPGAFWGALIPLVKFWSCMDLTHSVDSFNLPMPHQSGLEITAEVSNKCITSAVRMKKEENQSVVSFLREDRAAGGGGVLGQQTPDHAHTPGPGQGFWGAWLQQSHPICCANARAEPQKG